MSRLVRSAVLVVALIATSLLPAGGATAETIGDDLVARFVFSGGGGNPPTGIDLNTGMKVIIPEPFTELGTLTEWGFYSGSVSQFTPITPLIFQREVGTSNFTIVGVGENQVNTGATVNKPVTFAFNTLLGSAEVGSEFYFGFHQGASGVVLQNGSLFNSSNTFNFVDHTPNASGATPYLYHTGSGNNPAPNLGLTLSFTPFPQNRVYSLTAISVPIPEPSAMVLAAVGLLVVAARLRNARRPGG